MRGSLGLAAYRTLSGRRAPPDYTPAQKRPEGEVVWIHAAEEGNNRALNDLAHRLVAMRHGCHIVLTCASGSFEVQRGASVINADVPPDHPVVTDAFIKHWHPDVVIWSWGGFRPNLILSAAESGARMILIDAARDGFDGRRDRWLPEVPKRLLSQFSHVIARDQQAHLRLAQLGQALNAIELAAPLHPFGRTLSVAETDIAEMTEALGGRPVWLAARAVINEGRTILAAHRIAVKTSHRLLLILHFSDHSEEEKLAEIAQEMGLRIARWSVGELPDDNTQVLLADDDEDLGLWLRIAPVTFLGGSLRSGQSVIDPYAVAAHGTAMIYGPNVGAHVDAFTRLMNAGAARIVNSTESLGRAVIQMIAPDHAAQMAMAGWEVVTQGADTLDRIIELVQAHLDRIDQGLA
ncbi:glycosyltransferase N-terminal domain-containing protein [uncultured Tateyamaria sp.]|uniref:3-deoxy-D-manno-octulosonic acid transferase n=1 Tax=uncultured Tateyamaria sp. TaxID=455651 RepID=UPI0026137F52|nr:glycosyltransferase N-terminal domain-containing protein [uncultured Tateyamaria sp.]